MNKYLIQHKIKAIAKLGVEFESIGYKFIPCTTDFLKDSGALRHRLAHGSAVPDKDIVEVLPVLYEN